MKSLFFIALAGLSFFCPIFTFAQDQDIKPLRIGAVFPFTGKQARQGQLAKTGLELAFSELKDTFPHNVFYEDSRSDTKDAVTAFGKLQDFHRAEVVLTLGSPAAMALLPLANRSSTVLMAMVVVPGFSAPDDFGFRLMGTAPGFSERMKTLLLDELGKRRIALIYVEDDYGSGYAKVLAPQLEKAGVLAGQEAYLPGTNDYRPQLLKLKSASPDSVILASWAVEAGVILKQAKEIGLGADVYACPSACDNPDLAVAGAGATDQVVIIASDSRTSSEITNTLRVQFHESPTSVVLRFYDAALLLSSALKACNAATESRTVCLRDALAHTSPLPGSSYPLRFDANGDIVDQFQLKLIRGGELVGGKVENVRLVPE